MASHHTRSNTNSSTSSPASASASLSTPASSPAPSLFSRAYHSISHKAVRGVNAASETLANAADSAVVAATTATANSANTPTQRQPVRQGLRGVVSRDSDSSSLRGKKLAASAARPSDSGSHPATAAAAGAVAATTNSTPPSKGYAGEPLRAVDTATSARTSATATTIQSMRSAAATRLASSGFSHVPRRPEPGAHPKPAAPLTPEQQHKYDEMLRHFSTPGLEFPTSLNGGGGGGGGGGGSGSSAAGATATTAASAATTMRPASDWEKCRLLTRESMLRYLRATKWDVESAKRRLTDTLAWRREYGVDEIPPELVEPEARSGKESVLGFDRFARPLHYMHPHRNDTKESPRQMQFAVWILERCIDLMPPGVEQLALLINFEHRTRNPTSLANAKLMLYILQNHYVERLGVALCINVPWIFKAFYGAIQPFMDPVTKSKCKFDEAIRDEVPAAHLSREYGGELDSSYHHERYWPELIRTCDEIRAAMLRRFRERCHGEVGASEWVILGGEEGAAMAPEPEDDDEGHVAAGETKAPMEPAAVAAETPSSSARSATAAAEAVGRAQTPDLAMSSNLERFVTPAEGPALPSPLPGRVGADGHLDAEALRKAGVAVAPTTASVAEKGARQDEATVAEAAGARQDAVTVRSASTLDDADAAARRTSRWVDETDASSTPRRSASDGAALAAATGGVARAPEATPSLSEIKVPTARPGSAQGAVGEGGGTGPGGALHRRGGLGSGSSGSASPKDKVQHALGTLGKRLAASLQPHHVAAGHGGGGGSASLAHLRGGTSTPPATTTTRAPSEVTTADTHSEAASSTLEKHGEKGGQAAASTPASASAPVVAAAGASTATAAMTAPAAPVAATATTATAKPVTMLYFAAAKDAAARSNDEVYVAPGGTSLRRFADEVLPRHVAACAEALARLEAERVGKGGKNFGGEASESAAAAAWRGPHVPDVERLRAVLARSRWSVEREMVDEEAMDDVVLRGGEEVAVIPPVSGG